MSAKPFLLAVILLLVASASGAGTGAIRKQIDKIQDGDVRMTFKSRSDVCGDGRDVISFGPHGHRRIRSKNTIIYSDGGRWDGDCERGPVRVELRIRDGAVRRVRTSVGGEWRSDRDAIDLGTVQPEDAVDYMLSLVRVARPSVAEDAILPAVLAHDVVVWQRLLAIARDGSVAEGARKTSVFWLGQIAGEKATEGLSKLVDDDDVDMEVRKSAVFALSQHESSESIERLVEIARTSRHPQLRKVALFWLAESEDQRVLDIFEEILTE